MRLVHGSRRTDRETGREARQASRLCVPFAVGCGSALSSLKREREGSRGEMIKNIYLYSSGGTAVLWLAPLANYVACSKRRQTAATTTVTPCLPADCCAPCVCCLARRAALCRTSSGNKDRSALKQTEALFVYIRIIFIYSASSNITWMMALDSRRTVAGSCSLVSLSLSLPPRPRSVFARRTRPLGLRVAASA